MLYAYTHILFYTHTYSVTFLHRVRTACNTLSLYPITDTRASPLCTITIKVNCVSGHAHLCLCESVKLDQVNTRNPTWRRRQSQFTNIHHKKNAQIPPPSSTHLHHLSAILNKHNRLFSFLQHKQQAVKMITRSLKMKTYTKITHNRTHLPKTLYDS